MEYHVAGTDITKNKMKVEIPITQQNFIPLLTIDYHEFPDTKDLTTVHMHRSYIARMSLMSGLLPAIIIIPFLWMIWEQKSLWFLLYPLIIFIVSWCKQRKFRLWAMQDVLFVHKGILGSGYILLKWDKLQSVQIRQSIFQRSRNLASLIIHTAGGRVRVPFIDLNAARQLANYSLFKTEASRNPWH